MQKPIQKTDFRIPSFIRRQGRITPSQQAAIDKYSETYCLHPETHCLEAGFDDKNAPLFLEIGFGNGASLAEMAELNPNKNYIGVEVHRPGVGHLLIQIEQRQITNIRIYCHDAIDILTHNIDDNSLAGIFLFFPDPWPKKKHHKRRIVRRDFIQLIERKLLPGGFFHAATDWEHYAFEMLENLNQTTTLKNKDSHCSFSARPDYRPFTKFEKRGLGLGHGVWDLIFIKK